MSMMSDGAAAFDSVADEMDISQLFYSYHFSLDLFSTTMQMEVVLRDSYLTQDNALLYNAMSIAAFEEKYHNLYSCLVNQPRAQFLLKHSMDQKQK
jgi:hypothetical protein